MAARVFLWNLRSDTSALRGLYSTPDTLAANADHRILFAPATPGSTDTPAR